MKTITVLQLLMCLGCCSRVQGAFKDFVVDADEDEHLSNDLSYGCQLQDDVDEQQLISMQDLGQNGNLDGQLLLTALMQHAKRLGLNLQQLAQLQAIEDESYSSELEMGCNAADSLSYQAQPSWYDIFFN